MSELSTTLQAIRSTSDRYRADGNELLKLWRDFSGAVRDERIRKGISIRRAADGIGISKSVLCDLENDNGRCTWTLKTAARAAEYLAAQPELIEVP